MIHCWTADFVRLYEKNDIEKIEDDIGVIFIGASDLKDKEGEIESILIEEMKEYKKDIILPFYGFRETAQFKKINSVTNVLQHIEKGKSVVKDVKVKVDKRNAMLLRDLTILIQVIYILFKDGKVIDFLNKLKEKKIIRDYGYDEKAKVLSLHTNKHITRVFFYDKTMLEKNLLLMENLVTPLFVEAMKKEVEEYIPEEEETNEVDE